MIYIHIGPHKTGTSTLQAWLAANRELLMALGYCYPGKKDNHHLLARQIVAHKRQGSIPRLFGDYLRQIDSYPHGIISSENLDALGDGEIRALRNWLGTRPATIVAYARAPWDRSASMLGEQLKRLKYTRWGREWEKGGSSALPGLTGRSSLPSILRTWSSVFDRSQIKLRVLDRSRLVGGGLVPDFLDAIGLSEDYILSKSVKVDVKNEMPGVDQLRILRCASEIIAADKRDELASARNDKLVRRHVAAIIIQASNSIDIDLRRAALLSVDEVRLFKEAASDQVKLVAERYLNCAPDAVFSEPEWSRLPGESFDWSIKRVPYHGLEQLVLESAIAALDERSPLARTTIKKCSQLGDSAEMPVAAAAWLFAFKSPVLTALLSDKPLVARAICLCIGHAWARAIDRNMTHAAPPSVIQISKLFRVWKDDDAVREVLIRPQATPGSKLGPQQLVSLAIQSILIAGGGREVIHDYLRQVFVSERRASTVS